jgi:predicted secreted protein
MRPTLLLCLVVALSACGGGDPAEPGVSPDEQAPTSEPEAQGGESTATSDEAPAGETPDGTLTEADDGATVEVAVGEQLSWQLTSAEYDWEQPVTDSDAVDVVPVDYLDDPGYQEWLLVGLTAGTAQVTVEGLPACGDEEQCPQQTVTVTVEVTG